MALVPTMVGGAGELWTEKWWTSWSIFQGHTGWCAENWLEWGKDRIKIWDYYSDPGENCWCLGLSNENEENWWDFVYICTHIS